MRKAKNRLNYYSQCQINNLGRKVIIKKIKRITLNFREEMTFQLLCEKFITPYVSLSVDNTLLTITGYVVIGKVIGKEKDRNYEMDKL